MISRWARTWSARVFKPLLKLLDKAGVTPNMLTIASLISSAATGLLIAYHLFLWAALALVLSGLFDSLDGELARFNQQPTRLGGFIDSVCDHYGDFAIYLGILWLFIDAPSQLGIILVFLAMFGSLVGSHVRSRAGMVGIETKTVGFFTRMERTLVLLIGLVLGQMLLSVGLLALANNISALQRLVYALRAKHN